MHFAAAQKPATCYEMVMNGSS